jgi:hypothetical protein
LAFVLLTGLSSQIVAAKGRSAQFSTAKSALDQAKFLLYYLNMEDSKMPSAERQARLAAAIEKIVTEDRELLDRLAQQ